MVKKAARRPSLCRDCYRRCRLRAGNLPSDPHKSQAQDPAGSIFDKRARQVLHRDAFPQQRAIMLHKPLKVSQLRLRPSNSG